MERVRDSEVASVMVWLGNVYVKELLTTALRLLKV